MISIRGEWGWKDFFLSEEILNANVLLLLSFKSSFIEASFTYHGIHPFCQDHAVVGFPRGSGVKNPPAVRESGRSHGFDPWVGKIPWRRQWQPTPVFLPGESHGQRSLATKQHAVLWDIFIELCNCTCNLILEHFYFIPPNKKSPFAVTSVPTPARPR